MTDGGIILWGWRGGGEDNEKERSERGASAVRQSDRTGEKKVEGLAKQIKRGGEGGICKTAKSLSA